MLLQRADGTYNGGPFDVICILHDVATGRYHSAFFAEKPLPGQAGQRVGQLGFVRLKSNMHHTVGAATLEHALTHLDELSQKLRVPSENIWREPIDWDGQLGVMPEGNHEAAIQGIVTSPPWEKGAEGGLRKFRDPEQFAAVMSSRDGKGGRHGTTPESRLAQIERDADRVYGDSEGQIGQQEGSTYWEAVAQVYQECFKVLKPGGIMAVVVKDYVRDGQRVPLCDQTLELLEALGFEPLERIRAWLVESEYPTTLFSKEDERTFYEAHERRRRRAYESRAAKSKAEGKSVGVYRAHTFVGWLRAWRQKKRASFFRRDHEKKGSPAIDWEEVLVVRRNKINNQRR